VKSRWLAIIPLFLCFPAQAGEIVGKPEIHDGDTIKIDGQPIRLLGIDAPELKQRCVTNNHPWECGQSATNRLRGLINTKVVTCEIVKKDKYRRSLGECFIPSRKGILSVNQEMVKGGWALAYLDGGSFTDMQSDAAAENRGIWKSEFETPSDWRKEMKAAAKKD
jgi:endonuclease YncB( thermonuclease family)